MAKPTDYEIRRARQAFQGAKPKQFGNLHERHKYAMQLASEMNLEETNPALWHALWDLQTEVAGTQTASPPIGRRPVQSMG